MQKLKYVISRYRSRKNVVDRNRIGGIFIVDTIICLIIMIPFLIFAIVLSQGKGAFLLAGYNTMKESKKEIYNEKALAKFMGKIMYGYSFCILLWALDGVFKTEWLFIVSVVLFIGLTIFTLLYANSANRFKK